MIIFLSNLFAKYSQDDSIVLYLIGLVGGIVFLIIGLKKLKFKRMIMDLPTSKIKSLAMGFVEITGKVKNAEEIFISPLKQKKCVYFDLHIEKWVKRGKHSSWKTIYRNTKKSFFYLTEESERILIDTQDAELNFKKDIEVKTGIFNKMPDYIKKFCEKEGISDNFLGIKNKLRFRETYIEPNDELYIMGTAMKNNKLDKLQDSGTVKIGKNLNHPYFYISDYSEKEILSQFSWKIPLQIFGGSIAAIISFYFFVNYAIQYRLF